MKKFLIVLASVLLLSTSAFAGLESGTYISDLVATNPTSGDPKSEGDNHLRLIKSTVKATFPNIDAAVTSTEDEINITDGLTSTTAELNKLDGVTVGTSDLNQTQYLSGVAVNVQTQLDLKAPLASPALTGTPTAPTASVGTNTTQIATTAFVRSEFALVSLPTVASDFTVSVCSSGGDYTTINLALADITANYYPIYALAGVTGTINLCSGFTVSEQVFADAIDLDWLKITATDAVTTIVRSSLSTLLPGTTYYPAFGAINGGSLPRITAQFSLNSTGTATSRAGCVVHGVGSSVNFDGGGVSNAPYGLVALAGANASANDSDFDTATTVGILVEDGARVIAYLGDVSSSGGAGAKVVDGGYLDISYGTITSATTYGIHAQRGSNVFADASSATLPGLYGYFIEDGSVMTLSGATGTLGRYNLGTPAAATANTLYPDGIIFQSF